MPQALRTPDERFRDLADYPFEPRYSEVEGLRIHRIDEGRGSPILMMHGEPSWSYLYRKMIPWLLAAGHRVVAPDLVGFGRSDKPASRSDYTYAKHVAWMSRWLVDLDLREVTLVAQDWGGLIGLRLLAAFPERFARVVVANTGLPTGEQKLGKAFFSWQKFSQETPVFDVSSIVAGGCATELSPETRAAYDAPFPDESWKEGARAFPLLVPSVPDDPGGIANREAWKVLEGFTRPFLTAYSDQDPITKGADKPFQERVPGARGRKHRTIEGGGHFLQEDRPEELALAVLDAFGET